MRLDLFIDNLKLHHFHKTICPSDNSKLPLLNKYLKRIIKLVVNWEHEFCSDLNFV